MSDLLLWKLNINMSHRLTYDETRFLFRRDGIDIRVNYYSGQPIGAPDIIRSLKSCSIENQSTTIYWPD